MLFVYPATQHGLPILNLEVKLYTFCDVYFDFVVWLCTVQGPFTSKLIYLTVRMVYILQ